MSKEIQRVIADLESEVEDLKKVHGPSRYVGDGATDEYARGVADRGPQWGREGGAKTVAPGQRGSEGGSLAKSIMDVAQHRTDGMQPTWQAKALAEATDTAGGFLLVPEIANTVLGIIRNRTAVNRMAVTHVLPRSKSYVLPALATGASATWTYENAALPVSADTFSIAATLVPKPLGTLVAISNRLLSDAVAGNPSAAGSAADVIQGDLASTMAAAMDAGLLQGDVAGPAPKGILRTTGTTPLPAGTIATNGSPLTYGLLVSIVGTLQQASMPFSSPGWILSGRTLTALMSLTNTLGEPLLAPGGLLVVDAAGTTGRLLGYPFAVTNAISNSQTYGSATNASTIVFSSDWSELFVGDWQLFAIDSSQEASYTPDNGATWVSAYQNQQTVLRATLWADMAIRRPAAFVLAGGIVP